MAALATNTSVSMYEYLHTSYRPDVDYVDGSVEERNMGENEHSDLQSELVTLFRTRRKEWGLKAYTEHRVQVSAERFRVPDLCVMPSTWKKTPIIHEAPLLCVEILSPEDSFSRIMVRCNDYRAMGVENLWIVDPATRTVQVFHGNTSTVQRDGVLHLEGTSVEIPVADIFSVLDEE